MIVPLNMTNVDAVRSFPRGGRRKYSINSSHLCMSIYDVVSNDCKVYMICHLASTRNRRINRLSFNDNMFFYPEIRDENSRLGQRCLAQDARIKSVLAFAITGLHSQRYLEHTTILPLDFANHWFVAFLYWSSASRIYLL